MCDELTDADNERHASAVSRREFTAGAAAAGIAMVIPHSANAMPVKGRDVRIVTPDGECDAYFAAPESGKHPAVLVWPDIYGMRQSFRDMGDRLAAEGYAALTVNAFYRWDRPPYTQGDEKPGDPAIRARAFEYRKQLTPDVVDRDAAAFVAFLDAQPETDTARGIGTTGYCMGGPLVMRTAATLPGRVRAGASFHGAGLATDGADSPHLVVPKMKAQFLVAIAANDDERNPAEKDHVREAFAAAKLPAEIEVYPAQHGWCPPDSHVYDQVQAERAWERLLHLLKTAL